MLREFFLTFQMCCCVSKREWLDQGRLEYGNSKLISDFLTPTCPPRTVKGRSELAQCLSDWPVRPMTKPLTAIILLTARRSVISGPMLKEIKDSSKTEGLRITSGGWIDHSCKCELPTWLHQGFRKLSFDRQTDRHDQNYMPCSRGWSNIE